jgi:hypothetical protein
MQNKAEEDHMAKIIAADKRSAHAATARATQQNNLRAAMAASQVQVDSNGLRTIILEALWNEICLHRGQFPMK